MKNYTDTFKAIIDRRDIRYVDHGKKLLFSRIYSGAAADVRIKFVFILFPEAIDIGVTMLQPLEPEQATLTHPLLKTINKDLRHGTIEAAPSGCLRFSGSFDELLSGAFQDECPEMPEYLLEFIFLFTHNKVLPFYLVN